MNLKILPTTKYCDLPAMQKCLISVKSFPPNIRPGSLVRCRESPTGCDHIVRLFCLPNKPPHNICFMDRQVYQGLENHEESNLEKYVTNIELLERTENKVESISVSITLTQKIFKHSRINLILLVDILRCLLEPYCLVNNCSVKFNETDSDYGISEILVKADEKFNNCGFQISSNCYIKIENIKLERSQFIRPTDIQGLDDAYSQLKTLINCVEMYKSLNWKLNPALNALIAGPTGSGKTALCHNFIIENNCNTFLIKGSDLIQQYPGETEAALRDIFKNAKHFLKVFKPKDVTAIVIEDVDVLCPSKIDYRESPHISRVCNQLCSLLDELYTEKSEILVLGTSCEIEDVNLSVRRPGRFEKEILIPVLNETGRAEVLSSILSRHDTIDAEVSREISQYVATFTPGFVGADLMLLVQNALQRLMRSTKDFNSSNLKEFINESLQTIKPVSIRGADVTVYKSDMKFEDLGGMSKLKKTLEIAVLAGLKRPDAYERFGLQMPKGILLYGPPGCAKTTVAKCLANEANMTLISTSGAEVYSPYVGNAEKFIMKIFDAARKNAPCLIFLDEIDTLVGNRSIGSKNDVQTRVLSALLTEMDGIGYKISSISESYNNILVVAATNRPDMVDSALMRPGRFDKLIHVPAPDRLSRLAILEIFSKRMPFHENVNLENLADLTEDFAGADICNLCNEAAMLAFTENFDAEVISNEQFVKVLKKTSSSLSKSQIEWYFNFEDKYVR